MPVMRQDQADEDLLDERLAVEEPLLPLSSGSAQHRKKGCCAWYRSRVVAVLGVSVLLLGVAYAVVNSQIHRIATSAIKTTDMRIDAMGLSHPQHAQVALNLSLSLTSASAFPAQVDPATFTIVYADHQVGSFLAPAMHIRHGINTQQFPNATLRITNRTAWDDFARDMMRLSSVEYEIRGQLDLHVRLLGGLVSFSASKVPLEKRMAFRGMAGLREMRIASVEMAESTQTQVLATIKTCIKNPSVTTLRPVGALCLDAHYPTVGAATLVAHLTTPDNTSLTVAHDQPSHPFCAALTGSENMSKGYNLLELRGEMLGKNSAAISGLISKYLSNVSADLAVVTCEPQATSVDLYNEAMQNLTIPSALPPQKDPLVGRMFFQGIDLQPPQAGRENEIVSLGTLVKVEATSPLGSHSALTISDVRMKVNLTGEDVALGTLSTVAVDILDGRLVDRSNISVNCSTELALVDNGKPFGAFVRASVVREKVAMTLKGEMDVVCHGALGTLKLSGLPLRSTAWLDGMDNFRDVTILNFSLPGTGSSTEHGEPIQTQIKIRNPSVFGVSIGTLTMGLSLDEPRETFGQLHGAMNLAPGSNELSMTGMLTPAEDAEGRVSDAVADFFSRYLEGESSRVVVNITSTQYSDCIWMQEALLGLIIGTTFPGVAPGFQMISDIAMHQLDVILEDATVDAWRTGSNTKMLVRTDMKAKVKMPASIRIPLSISNLSVALTLENKARQSLGVLASGREPCEFNQTDDGAFRLNMTHFYPIALDDEACVDGMAGFITDLLTSNGSVMMRLATDAHTNQGAFPFVDTRMGMLALTNIPVEGAPRIPAMDSFHHPPVKVLSVDIKQGSRTSMVMAMEFELQNPSVVQTKLGALVLDVFFENARMGSAKMADFSLKCCGEPTILQGTFEYNPRTADLATAERFLSNFVSGYFTHGAAQEISIRGSTKSTSLDLLQPAMTALTIPSKLPTLGKLFPKSPTLVTSSLLYIPSLFHLTQIPTALELRNPFSENITVTKVDLELYPCEDQATANGTLVCKKYFDESLARFAPAVFTPIFIPASTSGCFSCCQGAHCEDKLSLCPHGRAGQCMDADVQSFLSPEAIATIIHSLTGGLLMRVNGTIGASIGEYPTRLYYQQDGLLVTMAKK